MIVQFLHFFFEGADQLPGLQKKVEFLDKEMAQISRDDERKPLKYVNVVGTGGGLYLRGLSTTHVPGKMGIDPYRSTGL